MSTDYQKNHYNWLELHLPAFLANLGVDINTRGGGLISAHGDKGYSWRSQWEQSGIPFEHGMALFLITYLRPWRDEVRDTPKGWVDVSEWVIANYNRFKDHLGPAWE